MPVATRGNPDKSIGLIANQSQDANMAGKQEKEPTIQDVLNSIKIMETTLNNKIEKEITGLQTINEATGKEIKDQLTGIENSLTATSDSVTALESLCDTQQKTINKLETRIEQLETKQRSHNMILEGLKETNGENLRAIISDMLEEMELSFTVEWVDTIYRMGPKRQGSNRRPVLLTFPLLSYKFELYRNAYKLKDMEKWKGIYLQDDLSPSDQIKKREARAIYSFAKSKGIDIKMRGMNLIIDNVKYRPNDQLPHNLSIENAKTVDVQDGIAFQGPHAIYSNLHQCDFVYEGRKHTSLEQALQFKRSQVGKQKHVGEKIMATDSSYEAMRLGNKIEETDEWNNDCVTYLVPIIKAKFDQNPALKAKLKAAKGHFYEATTHATFGCGLTLAQSNRICQANLTAGNQLGIEFEKLRDYYIRTESQQDGGGE